MLFIPRVGIEGAALASLISFFLANYILDAFSSKTRFIFMQKTKALFFIGTPRMIKNIFIFKESS
jgi:O-antigen/teichoic acid export membrane protein